MKYTMQFETTVDKMIEVTEQYLDFLANEVTRDVIERVFDLLHDYGEVDVTSDGLINFITDLSAMDSCDITVKLTANEDKTIRIIQVNTFGDYWGLDISIEPDGVFVFNGLSVFQANGLSN